MFKPPRTAELRHLCLFRFHRDFPTGNTLDEKYDTGIQRWSKIVPAKGSELHETAQTDNAITHKVLTREIPDVTSDHVMEHANKRYRVKRIMNITEDPEWFIAEVELLGDIPGV